MHSEKQFYDSLMEHFVKCNLDVMVYFDTFTNQRYASLGDGLSGFPKIYIDRGNSIGNVDIYGIEYFNPYKDEYILNLFECYLNKLVEFLTSYHESKGNGYVIYRKSKNSWYERTPDIKEDLLYKILKINHKPIDENHLFYKFINPYFVLWSFHYTEEVNKTFHKIRILASRIDFLNECTVLNYHLIEGDLLNKGINFKYNGTQYTCVFPENDILKGVLLITGQRNYVPLEFSSFYKIDLKSVLQELNDMNRLASLFE